MDKQQRIENVKSNIASLERQLDSVLFEPIKLMLELQLVQLHSLVLQLEAEAE